MFLNGVTSKPFVMMYYALPTELLAFCLFCIFFPLNLLSFFSMVDSFSEFVKPNEAAA